jgi:hypothetical protein
MLAGGPLVVDETEQTPSRPWHRKTTVIAALSVAAILAHLALRFGFRATPTTSQIPLLITLAFGGVPLLYDLIRKLLKREFGSDLLGGISIITSVLLGEYLAGSIIVLMLAGGEALESYALRSASSVLAALAKRMPSVAHRKRDAEIVDVRLQEVAVGDTLVIYPHDICPVDGVVIDGHGVMDESYLTGEPFQITKTRGSTVLSGAINGESALTIRTTQRAADSRYAKIMNVMRESESSRPTLRRLGDRLGAIYTPAPDRHPDRDHWLHFPVRPAGDHRQESRRARADRRVSHGDLRQDRDAHLWRANPDRTSDRPGLLPAGRADTRRESGALLETSAGARHPGVRDESRDADSGSH